MEKFAAQLNGMRIEEAIRKKFGDNEKDMLDEILFCAIHSGNIALVERLIRSEKLKDALSYAVRAGQQPDDQLARLETITPESSLEARLALSEELSSGYSGDDVEVTPFQVIRFLDRKNRCHINLFPLK